MFIPPNEHRECTHCGEDKDLSHFLSSANPSTVYKQCKECREKFKKYQEPLATFNGRRRMREARTGFMESSKIPITSLADKSPTPESLKNQRKKCSHCYKEKSILAYFKGKEVCSRCIRMVGHLN